MRYHFLICTAAAIIFSAAVPSSSLARPPLSQEIGIEILSDSGSGFRTIAYQDMTNGTTRIVKRYLEAKKGEKYAIIVRNNSPERIGLVMAVDGRNIISGKRSEMTSRNRMYVLGPYEFARYEGWRTSNNEVHRFYFTEPADSYSVKSFDDSSAMGVIAVAVFREKERPQPQLEERRQGVFPSAPSPEGARSEAKALDQRAGTGFGDAKYSPVITVSFEPETIPVQKILVKYEWRETLCRKGLLSCGRETGNRLWDDDGYAPYPPDYR